MLARNLPAAVVIAALLLSPGRAASPDWHGRPAAGAHAMVATEQHYATQVGLDVLRRGGNAVDAAVAVAYALAVVDPCCGNIGGGGFMIVRMHDGRERFIDFREKAPLRARPTLYQDRRGNVIPGLSTKGYLAVGVPGTVMGMEVARKEFGTMPRAALMAPAIALAQHGFILEPGDLIPFAGAAAQGYGGGAFANQPNVRAIFMRGGHLPRAGERLRQPQLAATLRLISAGGTHAFYEGPIARAVVAASRAHGGILSLEDFARYTVDRSQPVRCTYRGYRIASAPPPSSGGVTLCEILNVVSGYPLGALGWHSAAAVHDVVEAERRAYADRNTYLGDPRFVPNPIAQLLSPAYAAKLRAQISPDRATPSSAVHPGLGPIGIHESDDTTHFSIVDRWGNAVGVTFTINDWFGAGVIAGDTGFFLNDEMDDFTSKPGVPNMYGLVQGVRNDIRPGKRPLSSMTPTIVTRGGKVFLVTGSPGGSRIITIVLETLLDAIDYHMNVQDAVNAPRIHMQWLPDEVQYEPGALSPAVRRRLRAMGYTLKRIASWGSAQAVMVDPRTGMRYGGTDRRHPAGLALGY